MTDPIEQALNRHIAEMEKQDTFYQDVDDLAEQLDKAAFRAMRVVMQASNYDTTASDMFDAMGVCDEFFHEVAERLIKADKINRSYNK